MHRDLHAPDVVAAICPESEPGQRLAEAHRRAAAYWRCRYQVWPQDPAADQGDAGPDPVQEDGPGPHLRDPAAAESAGIGIKLGSVVSHVTGESATAMIQALIDGERRVDVMADLALRSLRAAGKQADLKMALAGRFTVHHAMLCRMHRDEIKLADQAVGKLDQQIAVMASRWQRELDLLLSIPGFGVVIAAVWLAEIGPAPHLWFDSHGKLASWVTLCPGPPYQAITDQPPATRNHRSRRT